MFIGPQGAAAAEGDPLMVHDRFSLDDCYTLLRGLMALFGADPRDARHPRTL
jgi:hypothetical protein